MAYDDLRRALSNKRRDILHLHDIPPNDLLQIYSQLTTRLREGGLSDAQQANLLIALKRINHELQGRFPGRKRLSQELELHMESLARLRQRNGTNGNGPRRNGNRGKRSRKNGRL